MKPIRYIMKRVLIEEEKTNPSADVSRKWYIYRKVKFVLKEEVDDLSFIHTLKTFNGMYMVHPTKKEQGSGAGKSIHIFEILNERIKFYKKNGLIIDEKSFKSID